MPDTVPKARAYQSIGHSKAVAGNKLWALMKGNFYIKPGEVSSEHNPTRLITHEEAFEDEMYKHYDDPQEMENHMFRGRYDPAQHAVSILKPHERHHIPTSLYKRLEREWPGATVHDTFSTEQETNMAKRTVQFSATGQFKRVMSRAPSELVHLLTTEAVKATANGCKPAASEDAALKVASYAGWYDTGTEWKQLAPDLRDKVALRKIFEQPDGKFSAFNIPVFYANAVKMGRDGQPIQYTTEDIENIITNTNKSNQLPALTPYHVVPEQKLMGVRVPTLGRAFNFRASDREGWAECDFRDLKPETVKQWREGEIVSFSPGIVEDGGGLNRRFGHIAMLGAESPALSALPTTEIYECENTVCFAAEPPKETLTGKHRRLASHSKGLVEDANGVLESDDRLQMQDLVDDIEAHLDTFPVDLSERHPLQRHAHELENTASRLRQKLDNTAPRNEDSFAAPRDIGASQNRNQGSGRRLVNDVSDDELSGQDLRDTEEASRQAIDENDEPLAPRASATGNRRAPGDDEGHPPVRKQTKLQLGHSGNMTPLNNFAAKTATITQDSAQFKKGTKVFLHHSGGGGRTRWVSLNADGSQGVYVPHSEYRERGVQRDSSGRDISGRNKQEDNFAGITPRRKQVRYRLRKSGPQQRFDSDQPQPGATMPMNVAELKPLADALQAACAAAEAGEPGAEEKFSQAMQAIEACGGEGGAPPEGAPPEDGGGEPEGDPNFAPHMDDFHGYSTPGEMFAANPQAAFAGLFEIVAGMPKAMKAMSQKIDLLGSGQTKLVQRTAQEDFNAARNQFSAFLNSEESQKHLFNAENVLSMFDASKGAPDMVKQLKLLVAGAPLKGTSPAEAGQFFSAENNGLNGGARQQPAREIRITEIMPGAQDDPKMSGLADKIAGGMPTRR